MARTYRRDNRRGTQKNEPYQKRVKNENLNNYKGLSSEDFDDEFEDVQNYEDVYDYSEE